MATWKERLTSLLGPGGYDPAVMRRSVQTVVLYEAQRCLKSKLPTLRPFQRKIAFYDQTLALLSTLVFIPAPQRTAIMWRTGTAREVMTAEVAWKRSRLIERELRKISEKVKLFMQDGKSHEQACEAVVQEHYESVANESKGVAANDDGKLNQRPPNWEHSHNNMMMTFRLYYLGHLPDPDFPVAKLAIPVVVPAEKPPKTDDQSRFIYPGGATATDEPGDFGSDDGEEQNTASEGAAMYRSPGAERQQILTEVRDHLDLLKEFEGVVSEEEINKRKRQLFLALPPAPPPANGKRTRI